MFEAAFKVMSALFAASIAMFALGQSLSPELPVDEPVWWPTGGAPHVAETASGYLISVVAAQQGYVRPVAFDGTLGPLVRLGKTDTIGTQLINGTQGVVAVICRPDDYATQVLDPVTGQPMTAPVIVGENRVTPGYSRVSGAPGRLRWLRLQSSASTGKLQMLLTGLNDDGTLGPPTIDLTAMGSRLVGFVSTATKSWVQLDRTLSDGGQGSNLYSINDDGSYSLIAVFEGFALDLAITSSAIAAAVNGSAGVTVMFFDFDGLLVGQTTLSALCSSATAVGDDDEVWLTCAEVVDFNRSTTLSLSRVTPDGGVRKSVVYRSDGGELFANTVLSTHSATPRLVFSRRYKELSYGNWVAAMLLPLTPDGLAATGEPVPVIARPNAQWFPSFATRGRQTPNALAWNDDRQLPFEFLLQAVRVAPDGSQLEAPRELERLTSNFTNVNASGRLIGSAGDNFLLSSWNGFWVEPLDWPGDGGPAVRRATVANGITLPLWPITVGTSADGLVTVSDPFSVVFAQRLDTHGNAVGARTQLTQGRVFDVLHDGSRYVQLLTESARSRLYVGTFEADNTVGELRTLVVDAGIAAGRLAQSNDVLLAAWESKPSDDVSQIRVARLRLDGGLLDVAPTEFVLPSQQYLTGLTDIGVRDGVFYLLGRMPSDGGMVLWLWRIADDGGVVDQAPIVYDDVAGVASVAAGPTTNDGSLLIAYSRTSADWPEVPRVFVRRVADRLDAGNPCERNTDCLSNRCAQAVCANGGAGPRVHQVCGCGVGPPHQMLWVVGALVAMGRRRHSRASTQSGFLSERTRAPADRARCPIG